MEPTSTISFEALVQSKDSSLVTSAAYDQQLPIESMEMGNDPRQSDAFGAAVQPTPATEPKMLAYSEALAAALGFDVNPNDTITSLLSGNSLLQDTQPFAMNYGGHQFGHWAGQLGDGRAINLFEMNTPVGRRSFQLKGAGPTAFSRRGDGYAVLRSSIREFLCSEAMHCLGVPTTRALSLIDRGDLVWRDLFYDGHPEQEQSAVVCRVAPSFIRFGHFELLARRGDQQGLKQLVEFTLRSYFPTLLGQDEPIDHTACIAFFAEVCATTAALVARWQSLGFTHGVLNTDNMSIHGITIDYGPFGWLESFDPNWTPNTTDAKGRRYAFGRQPQIVMWNLWQLANALAYMEKSEALSQGLSQVLSQFQGQYETCYQDIMGQKLGLQTVEQSFLTSTDALFEQGQIDMVCFFRGLSSVNQPQDVAQLLLKTSYQEEPAWLDSQEVAQWIEQYFSLVQQHGLQQHGQSKNRQQTMDAVNPCYVPRNYLLYQAIQQAEQGDLSMVHRLHSVWQDPYVDQGHEDLKSMRPHWAQDTPGCSALSCSS